MDDHASYRRLKGANMDIDLATLQDAIGWAQARCPWNEVEGGSACRCAIKNISLCQYFRGVEYPDTLFCCYPDPNPAQW